MTWWEMGTAHLTNFAPRQEKITVQGVSFGGVPDKQYTRTPDVGNRCAYADCAKGVAIGEGEPARFALADPTKWCHKDCADVWEARVRNGDVVAPPPAPATGLCNAPNPDDYAVRCSREDHKPTGHHMHEGRAWYLAPAAVSALEAKIAAQQTKGTSHPPFEPPALTGAPAAPSAPDPNADENRSAGAIPETAQEAMVREAHEAAMAAQAQAEAQSIPTSTDWLNDPQQIVVTGPGAPAPDPVTTSRSDLSDLGEPWVPDAKELSSIKVALNAEPAVTFHADPLRTAMSVMLNIPAERILDVKPAAYLVQVAEPIDGGTRTYWKRVEIS